MTEAMLEVRNLHVAYGAIVAVEKLDLEVGSKDVVALLGPNGAGKSSTLLAISGLVGSSGAIRFDGIDLSKRNVEATARLGLIQVPEGRRIFPTLSVHENLQVSQSAVGRREATFVIDDVYDLFPRLAPMKTRGGWALSGGEQQMLAVGRGLVSSPRMLLLDEPSLGLAPLIVQDVFGALKQIREQVPVLVVEQNTAVALDIADRGYVMSDGEIVLSGTADELRDRGKLLDSYLGRTDVEVD
jgi:branched-chain amino acid transport system ATP-binding protein